MTKNHSESENADLNRRKVLGEFLRQRREKTKPEDVGIIATGKRRTPGLRREELAQIAGVSVSWYTWLEQGREISVSDEVLSSIAHVLVFDKAEREYLFQLSKNQNIPEVGQIYQPERYEVQEILDSFGNNPAYVIDNCWNLVAGNQNAYKLFVAPTVRSYDSLPWHEKNLIWTMFTNPYQKELMLEWEEEAKRSVALFRYSSRSHIGDSWYSEFIENLKNVSPEFEKWWQNYNISPPNGKKKQLNHPVVGNLNLEVKTLLIPEYPNTQLVVYLGTDPETSNKLSELSKIMR
ncbi:MULTISPECIES: helix-turn-helix transcriptional regulator [Vagococcus]|uniref:DNA-binding protein n=1 Tax=Vagococcus fluvialis bH819 TaxID=1255619 RepID=A0A1X6WR44_9ENTE|nr:MULTISPECIES: helix-turn-helix transcriptional regulator [Vagococcus]SLM86821.1 DNA-binding protein [Vagococcus fluvialis bH819]HCM88721.1 XRE family transcriptional regulator [Vagococcus sp.]